MTISDQSARVTRGMRSDRIVGLLWTREVSISEFARVLGMAQPTLSMKLHGKRRWYLEEVLEVADALGTTVAYLTGETEDPRPYVEAVDAVEWAEFQLWRARRDSNSQPSDP